MGIARISHLIRKGTASDASVAVGRAIIDGNIDKIRLRMHSTKRFSKRDLQIAVHTRLALAGQIATEPRKSPLAKEILKASAMGLAFMCEERGINLEELDTLIDTLVTTDGLV